VAEGAWLAERIAGWVCAWREFLMQRDEDGFAASMQRHERTGRPLGKINLSPLSGVDFLDARAYLAAVRQGSHSGTASRVRIASRWLSRQEVLLCSSHMT
jgi:hypothetical protein